MKLDMISLAEFCDSVRDGTHDTPKPTSTGKYLVTSKAINNNSVDFISCYYISENDYIKINKRSLVEKWDVLMTMIGTVGRLLLVTDIPDFAIKNIALFKIGDEIKAKWLYYYLSMPSVQTYFEMIANGTSQHFISLGHLRKLQIVNIPKNGEIIVSILSNYDTLIDINSKRIKLLEESARELYKEWFLRMRFPGYEQTKFLKGIPEGWKVVELRELVTTQYGLTTTAHSQKGNDNDVYYLRITDIVDNNINWAQVPYCSADDDVMRKYKLCQGDILVARTGATVGYATQIQKIPYEAVFASYLIRLKAKNKLHISYIGMSVVSDIFRDYIQSIATGAAQPMANPHLMTSFKLLLPSEHLLKLFNEHIDSVNDIILNLQLQNQNLAATRDRLLPRLLSGELKVKA